METLTHRWNILGKGPLLLTIGLILGKGLFQPWPVLLAMAIALLLSFLIYSETEKLIAVEEDKHAAELLTLKNEKLAIESLHTSQKAEEFKQQAADYEAKLRILTEEKTKLQTTHKAELAKAQATHQSDLANQQAALAKAQAIHQNALTALQASHSTSITALQTTHQSDLANQQAALAKAQATHQSALTALQASHSTSITALQTTHQSDLANQQAALTEAERSRKQSDGLYKQMREQFNEKNLVLLETRSELFKANEKVNALIHANEEASHNRTPQEAALERLLLATHREQQRQEKEVEALHAIVSNLT